MLCARLHQPWECWSAVLSSVIWLPSPDLHADRCIPRISISIHQPPSMCQVSDKHGRNREEQKGRKEVRKLEKKKKSGVRYSVEGLWSVSLYWKSVLEPLRVSSWVTGIVTWVTKRDVSAPGAWMFHVKDTGALWEDDCLNNDSAILLVSKDHCSVLESLP